MIDELDYELVEEEEEALETLTGSKRIVQKLANAAFATPLRTAAMLTLMAGSIAVVIWNLGYRLTVFDTLVEVEVQKNALESELNAMRNKLSKIDPQELESKISVENSRVFRGFPQAAAWIQQLDERAQKFQLSFNYEVEPTRASPIPDVLEMPIVFHIHNVEEGVDSAFSDIMQFIGTLVADRWHLDSLTTQATGTGDSLKELHVRAVVWVRDPHGFVIAAQEHQKSIGGGKRGSQPPAQGMYEEIIQ